METEPFELDYAGAIDVISPLVNEYPQNPVFELILGDTQAKLNHKELAEANFHAAASAPVTDTACAARIQMVVAQAQATLDSHP